MSTGLPDDNEVSNAASEIGRALNEAATFPRALGDGGNLCLGFALKAEVMKRLGNLTKISH